MKTLLQGKKYYKYRQIKIPLLTLFIIFFVEKMSLTTQSLNWYKKGLALKLALLKCLYIKVCVVVLLITHRTELCGKYNI